MLNIIRLNRRLIRWNSFIGIRRLIHWNKRNEIDDPNYHKQPLDQRAVQLIKRYQEQIIYSSYLESNKIPLNMKERSKLFLEIQRKKYEDRLNDARTSEPSIMIEKILPDIKEHPEAHEQNEEKPECTTNIELSSVDGVETEENQEKKRQLAKSKLKILTEMGLRRSVLDFESDSIPENWMEDYETYDEDDKSETLVDSRYGTSGEINLFVFYRKWNAIHIRYLFHFRSQRCCNKSTVPWMWCNVSMCGHKFAWLFAK